MAALSAFAFMLLTGCANTQLLRQKCPTPPDLKAAAESPAPTAAYQVGCPDVLQVNFTDYPSWDAIAVVDVDGRLPLEYPGKLQVEDRTLEEVRNDLATLAGCSPDRVSVSLSRREARASSSTAPFAGGRAWCRTRVRNRSSIF
jgi:polysaccharide biosynthesis/export protein